MPIDDRSWATFVGGLDDATKRRLVQYVAGLNQAEARAYQPSMRDRLGAAIAGDSRPGDVRYNLAQGLVGSAGVGGSGIGLGDFTPAGVPMAASDAAKFAREGDYVGAGLSAAGVVAPGLKSGRAAMAGAANAADETAKGIRAYHGSPHDFDRFSLDKIGTGEGAQAYGHGLYFAESEGVAKSYRDNLSPAKVDGVPAPRARATSSDEAFIFDVLKHERTPENARFRLDRMNKLDLVEKLDEMVASGRVKPGGSMYEVNIRANPDDFLDWDKPIPDKYAQALREKGFSKLGYQGAEGYAKAGDVVARYKNSNIENALKDAGAAGIKYLDAGSRAAGDGSRNYVVFDDSLIEILRKYGLLAPIGAAAAGSALLGDAEAERY